MAKRATSTAKSSNGDLNHHHHDHDNDPLLSTILASSQPPQAASHHHQTPNHQNQPPVYEELPPWTYNDSPAWQGIHVAALTGATLGIPAHYRVDTRNLAELQTAIVTHYLPMVFSSASRCLVPFYLAPRPGDDEEPGEDEWGQRPSGAPPLQQTPPTDRLPANVPVALVPVTARPLPKPRAGWRAVADAEAAKPPPPPATPYHHTLRSLQTADPEEELDDPQGSFLYHFEETVADHALSFHLPMRKRWTEPVTLSLSEALAPEAPSRRFTGALFPVPFCLPTGLVRALTIRQIIAGSGESGRAGLGPGAAQGGHHNPLAAARDAPLYAVELLCDPAEVWLHPALLVGNHVEVLVRLRDATPAGKAAVACANGHGPLLAETAFELHRAEGVSRTVVAFYLSTAAYVASAVAANGGGGGGGTDGDSVVSGAFPHTIELATEIYLRNGFTKRPRRVEVPLVTICPEAVHLRGEPLAVTGAAGASLPCLVCKRIATPLSYEPPSVMRCKGKFISNISARLRIEAFQRHFEAEIGAVGAGGPQGSARFNLLQGTVFSVLYETPDNVFIGAGSGTGKRVAAQFAIMQLFGPHFFTLHCGVPRVFNKSCCNETVLSRHHVQAVFLTPKRETLGRMFKRWRVTFAETFGAGGAAHFRVVMLTGDPEEDLRLMEGAHLIMATPYDWNFVATLLHQYHLPPPTNNAPTTGTVQLYILDDLHLLATDEAYELVLTRLRYRAKRQEATCRAEKAAGKEPKPRFVDRAPRLVALSGRPLENIGEVRAYLNVSRENVFNFTPGGASNARMVPVATVVAEVAPPPELLGNSSVPRRKVQLQAMADAAYQYIRALEAPKPRTKPVIVWVPYAEDAFAVAFRLLAADKLQQHQGSPGNRPIFPEGTNSPEALRPLTSNAQLRSTLARGIGFITESSTVEERALVERLFRSSSRKLKNDSGGQLKPLHVVVVQQALVYDLTLKAYLVIVLDGTRTTYNVGNDQLEADVSLDELEKLLYCPAGRPTADLEARAVFLCRPTKEAAYVQALAAEYAGSNVGVESLFGKRLSKQNNIENVPQHIIPPLRPLESGLFSIGEPGGGLGGRPGSTSPLLATLSAEILYGSLATTDQLNAFLLELFLFRRLAANVTYYVSRLAEVGVITAEGDERAAIACGVCQAEQLLRWVPHALWTLGLIVPEPKEEEKIRRRRHYSLDLQPLPLASRPPIDAIAFNHRVDPAYVAFLANWCRDFGTCLWRSLGDKKGRRREEALLKQSPSSAFTMVESGSDTEKVPKKAMNPEELAFRDHVESVSPLKMFVFLTSPLEYLRDGHNHFDVGGGGDGRRLSVRYGEIALLRKMISDLREAYGVEPVSASKESDKEDKKEVNGGDKENEGGNQNSKNFPKPHPSPVYHPEADFADAQRWADGLLLPSEIGKARAELLGSGAPTLSAQNGPGPPPREGVLDPIRAMIDNTDVADEEVVESLEELYRRLSVKSLPYHQAKAKLLLLFHFARLPLPEAAPWLATEQAEAVMTAHRHVLAAVDVFLHARLLRFALAAMELATGLVQAVLPLSGGEELPQPRKAINPLMPAERRQEIPPVGRLEGASLRQISPLFTDELIGNCFRGGLRTVRKLRLLRQFLPPPDAREDSGDQNVNPNSNRQQNIYDEDEMDINEDIDRFIEATPEPRLYISQLSEDDPAFSLHEGKDEKSNKLIVKLVVELKCHRLGSPETVVDQAADEAAIKKNVEREIKRCLGTDKDSKDAEDSKDEKKDEKDSKKDPESSLAGIYRQVLVADGEGGQKVARLLTPAVVEELMTRYCEEQGLVYGGPDIEDEDEDNGEDNEDNESNPGGVGSGGGVSPERITVMTFPKPITEKWWLLVTRPHSGRINTVAFLAGQSGRLLLTVAVPKKEPEKEVAPVLSSTRARLRANRYPYSSALKPEASKPPPHPPSEPKLDVVLLLLKNSVFIGRDRLYRLHFLRLPNAVRYVGAIEQIGAGRGEVRNEKDEGVVEVDVKEEES